MIEVNLIPDVKQELLKARRIRNAVVSISIIVSIVAVAIVTLLSFYVFAGQWAQNAYFDGRIKDEQKKIEAINGAADLLTIQNQLVVLPQTHDTKHMTSRIFSTLATINPTEPNNVQISKVTLSTTDGTIAIEGQAVNGFAALETFQKTIEATKIEFTKVGSSEVSREPLASDLAVGEKSFGEDASGSKVLRFTLSFKFGDGLLSRSSTQLKIVGPNRTNVTDSFIGIPEGLFIDRADDVQEGN